MSPMETVEHLIRKGWNKNRAIAYVQSMMKFPWGIQEDPQILERLNGVH